MLEFRSGYLCTYYIFYVLHGQKVNMFTFLLGNFTFFIMLSVVTWFLQYAMQFGNFVNSEGNLILLMWVMLWFKVFKVHFSMFLNQQNSK